MSKDPSAGSQPRRAPVGPIGFVDPMVRSVHPEAEGYLLMAECWLS